MALAVNSNVASLNAQRNLNRTQADLGVALNRLSSGLRINSAKDDAAGIAIVSRFNTQIGGLTVAIRNANDGISISQTAEGAIQEMVDNLNRAHDLALQAASYNTDSDRTSLNQEVQQIIQELNRVVSQTRFNGQQLLTGSFSANVQVGTSVNETINVAVSNLSPTSLGVASNYSTVDGYSNTQLAQAISRSYRNAIATTDSIDSTNFTTAVAADSNSSAKVDAINAISSTTGVSAFTFGNGLVGTDFTAATANTNSIAAGALTINGVSIDAVAASTTNTLLADNLVDAINAKSAETGVTAVNVNDANGDSTTTENAIVLVSRDGKAITVQANSGVDSDITTFFADGTTTVAAGANGAIVLNDTDSTDTSVAFNSAGARRAIDGQTGAATTVGLATQVVNSQTVATVGGANLSLLVFEAALDSINADRAALGAKLNRLESVVRNLENARENFTAARGRIQDADFAEETSRLTRAQILQQAGVSIVAQANALPQAALALLQG